MQNEQNHIHYSIADIEQYLQGKMSAADMHRMEKAALQDPFLADAIEGYRNASAQQSHKHLEEIEQAIIGQKEDTKIVPIKSNKRWKWSVAASVLAVALVGSIIWMLNKKGNENIPVAKTNQASTVTQSDSIVLPLKADSVNNKPIIASNYSNKKSKNNKNQISKGNIETNLARTEFVPSKTNDSIQPFQDIVTSSKKELIQKPAIAKALTAAPTVGLDQTLQGKVAGLSVAKTKGNNSLQESEIFIRGTNSSNATNNPMYIVDGIILDSMPSTLNPSSIKKVEIVRDAKALSLYGSKAANGAIVITTNAKMIKGRVIAKNGAPISFATIAYNKNKAVATDSAGYFFIDAKDSLLNATVSSIGYHSSNIKLSNNKLNQIELKESTQNLDEVVVIGYGAQMKRDVTGAMTTTKKENVKDKAITENKHRPEIIPQGGWDNFKRYLKNKIKADSTMSSLSGNIEFKITLNADGTPAKVHILQSPDKNFNSQLSKAILEGPKWNTGNKKQKNKKINIQL